MGTYVLLHEPHSYSYYCLMGITWPRIKVEKKRTSIFCKMMISIEITSYFIVLHSFCLEIEVNVYKIKEKKKEGLPARLKCNR